MNRRKINNLNGEDTKFVVVYLSSDLVSEGFNEELQAIRRKQMEEDWDRIANKQLLKMGEDYEEIEIELLTIDEFEEKYQSEES